MSRDLQFRIFKYAPDDVLEIPYVAPALQAIETAFFLASHDRWQSVVAILGGSCELLLKGKYDPEDTKNLRFFELIKLQESQNKITSNFAKQAHNIRKLRNEVMHTGLTPKDDFTCIKSFFFDIMPYLRKILDKEYGIDLWHLASSHGDEYTKNWIANVYTKTRRAIHEKEKRNLLSEEGLRICIIPIQLCFGKIFHTGYNSPNASPIYTFKEEAMAKMELRLQNTDFEISDKQRELIFDYFGTTEQEETFAEVDVCCPVCNWNFLVIPEQRSDKIILEAIGCEECGYRTKDEEMCRCFCTNDFSDKDIESIRKVVNQLDAWDAEAARERTPDEIEASEQAWRELEELMDDWGVK